MKQIFGRRNAPEPQRINESTLDEVVRKYLRELNNPAPDPTMRDVYREWMGEFVGVDWRAESEQARKRAEVERATR